MSDFPYSVSVDLNLSIDVEGADENTPKDEIKDTVEDFINKIFEKFDAEYQILEIRDDDGESIYNIGE